MIDPQFRPAGPADADLIAPLLDAAYAPHRATLPDLPDMTEGLADDLAQTENWMAEDDKGAKAVLLLMPDADALFIKNLAVRPDTQGQGLARKLMALAETRAHTHGLPCLRLTTHADMSDTIAVYKKLGFEVTQTFPGALRMEKPV